MDYEKKYKNALEWARQVMNGETGFIRKEVEEIFPELAESEDERIIRKELLEHCINRRDGKQVCVDASDYRRWADWLEKQGKEESIDMSIKEKAHQIAWETSKHYAPLLSKESWCEMAALDMASWLEKQGEQKPVDKVEPKFHVGEWIIFNENQNSVYQVEKIGNCRYYLRHYLGGTFSVTFDNELIRRWTIEDAWDGDILYSPGNNLLWIYKDSEECHCCINLNYNSNNISFDSDIVIPSDVCPATIEQRVKLEEEIAKAGYTFDFNKKELNKIEENPAEIENIEHGKYYYCIKDYYAGGNKRASKGEVVQALRGMNMMALGVKANEYFIPVKSITGDMDAWSEEDEETSRGILNYLCLHDACELEGFDDWYNWLKSSIKDKVQSLSQPKEWSEEDKKMFVNIKACLRNSNKDYSKEVDWLKALKERYTWKPSD